MQGVVDFLAVERQRLSIAKISRRHRIESVPRRDAGLLNSGAIRKVGSWKYPDGLLPIGGERLLGQIIGVNGGCAFQFTPLRMISRIVIIDAGQNSRGQSEHRVFDTEARGQRPSLQPGIVVAGVKVLQRKIAEETRLLILVA